MRRSRRPGLSLLEVIFAMAIFLMALAALTHLTSIASSSAYEAKHRSHAAHLARSKMAEVRIGALPLESVGQTTLEDDSDYQWQMDVGSGPADGLSHVAIRVFRERPNGSRIEASMSELVFDPARIGSTMDVPAATTSSTPESAGSASDTAPMTDPMTTNPPKTNPPKNGPPKNGPPKDGPPKNNPPKDGGKPPKRP